MTQAEWDDTVRAVSEVADIARDLEPDARRTLLRIGRRLIAGQRQYGRLDLKTDKRQWLEEMAQEAADLLVYTEFELLRTQQP